MKKLLRKFLVEAIRPCLRGETTRRLVAEAMAIKEPLHESVCDIGGYRFYCIGDLALYRAKSLFEKEPETIEWIKSFKFDDVFWDIGANVGIYSIFAAAERWCRVFAFEPQAANYLLLNRNIEQNYLASSVRGLCVAFSDRTDVDFLNLQSSGFGEALACFGDNVDLNGERFPPEFRQGAMSFTIDEFLARFDVPFPTHIKIDVDGIEAKIIAGAKRTLADRRLKSVQVELEDNRLCTQLVAAQLENAGLGFVWKRHAAEFDDGAYGHVWNCLYRRA